MDILLDDPRIEKTYQEIVKKVSLRMNGETVDQMKAMGMNYKVNWGASIISLRNLAKEYDKNHLLALKLWNKQWRETKILATLLEEPDKLTEEQMDFWTKSFETLEMAEQAVANLYVHSKFAFVKAYEYCCGKKPIVHQTGLLLIGRLAMVDKSAIDEMFEPFFKTLTPLAKDPALKTIFYRTMVHLANRSEGVKQMCKEFLESVQQMEEEHPRNLAKVLLQEIADE